MSNDFGAASRATSVVDIESLRAALEEVSVADDVASMVRYLKDQFPMIGVRTAARREAAKPFMRLGKGLDNDDVLAVARACWEEPEREFHYVGADWLRRWVKALDESAIEEMEWFITTHAWWDTVDTLATRVVGPLVAASPGLAAVMDQWIDDDDIWLARTALLYQLNYGEETDVDRLFRYCLKRADHTDFFIRKAIGWALRQQARQTPDRVAAFVADHEERFSGLTRREALKHL